MSIPWFRFSLPYRLPGVRPAANNGVAYKPVSRKMPPVKPTDSVLVPRWVLALFGVVFAGVFSWAVSLSYRAELATETRQQVREMSAIVNRLSVDVEIIKHKLQQER